MIRRFDFIPSLTGQWIAFINFFVEVVTCRVIGICPVAGKAEFMRDFEVLIVTFHAFGDSDRFSMCGAQRTGRIVCGVFLRDRK